MSPLSMLIIAALLTIVYAIYKNESVRARLVSSWFHFDISTERKQLKKGDSDES